MEEVRAREVPAFCVDFPARLLPYLEDLVKTGLWGSDLDDTVVACVQEVIQKAVLDGFIASRVNGKKVRR